MMHMSNAFGRLSLLALVLSVSACSGGIVPRGNSTPVPQTAPLGTNTPESDIAPAIAVKPIAATPLSAKPVATVPGSNAASLGVVAGPDFASFNVDGVAAKRALVAFRLTCNGLMKRKDLSGLTQAGDWTPVCAAASTAKDSDAATFFAENFSVAQVGDGKSFATGYYEPEILGSRTKSDKYAVPVYGRPPELVEIDLGDFSDTLKGKKLRGRVEGKTFVPYADRTAIETGALEGRGLEIAWAADPVDFFVLQVQGSGKLRLPDGGVMRIAYDSQNGRDYTGIGKVMKERGLLQPGKATMDDLTAWLKANPSDGVKIMRENKSWVFFKELTGPGPVGAMNQPVVAKASVATDPMYVPLGAPVFLSMDRAEASGLWVAQDTGGAIKGSNRFDTFWGEGASAKLTAGGMATRGTAFVLLPRAAFARLLAAKEAARAGTTP
jgi:membrane-bound lytic murein transglycosylase A